MYNVVRNPRDSHREKLKPPVCHDASRDHKAVLCTLGITHAERNGHHYFAGLSMYPEDVQEAVLASHGSLYRRHEGGFPTLDVSDGEIRTDSVVEAPFGYGMKLDTTRFTPLADWSSESLSL